jgi:hypothetical protein
MKEIKILSASNHFYTPTRSFQPLLAGTAEMDGFEVRMYFIEILRKMNALVTSVLLSSADGDL